MDVKNSLLLAITIYRNIFLNVRLNQYMKEKKRRRYLENSDSYVDDMV